MPGPISSCQLPCLQIAVGYCLATALGLLAERRQRQAFVAEHSLAPPSRLDLLVLLGSALVMLLLLCHLALAEVLPPTCGPLGRGGGGGDLAAVAAASCAADSCAGGTL